jgi:hypothetical protein
VGSGLSRTALARADMVKYKLDAVVPAADSLSHNTLEPWDEGDDLRASYCGWIALTAAAVVTAPIWAPILAIRKCVHLAIVATKRNYKRFANSANGLRARWHRRSPGNMLHNRVEVVLSTPTPTPLWPKWAGSDSSGRSTSQTNRNAPEPQKEYQLHQIDSGCNFETQTPNTDLKLHRQKSPQRVPQPAATVHVQAGFVAKRESAMTANKMSGLVAIAIYKSFPSMVWQGIFFMFSISFEFRGQSAAVVL